MRYGVAALAAGLLLCAAAQPGWAGADAVPDGLRASDLSAQTRRAPRRPTRITVRPLRPAEPRDLRHYHRECVPVMVERWIPQWGGTVIHASQRCWWVRD